MFKTKCIIFGVAMSVSFLAWSDAEQRLMVIGDATWGGWSLDKAAVMLPSEQNGQVFTYTGWLEADKEFKFLTEAAWDRVEYRNASAQPYILGDGGLIRCQGGAQDNKFKVRQSANYKIVCNLGAMTVNVTAAQYQDAPVYHNALYLVGSATPGGWLLPESLPLVQDKDNPFKFSAKVNLEAGIFKIATNCWGDYREQKFYYRDAADAARITEDASGDRQWTVATPGVYTITVDLRVRTIDVSAEQTHTTLGAVEAYDDNGTCVTVTAANGTLILTPYAPTVMKVYTQPKDDTRTERRSISVCATPKCAYAVSENDNEVCVKTSGMTAAVSKADGLVTFIDANGSVKLREARSLDNEGGTRRMAFEGMNDRAFYGGGYNGRFMDISGVPQVMNNTQTGGWDCTWSAPHNICVPLVVSTEGYGLYFDDHYRYARIVPSGQGTTYSSQSPTPTAYYYIGSEDGTMADVMRGYTNLTGRQPLPPYWALGYMTSRYGYKSQAEATDVVDNIKRVGLPLDGIVFDLYWQGEGNSGMGNLDWYRPNFADAAGMMKQFKQRGVKTVCITEPYFTSVSANYDTARARGFLADEDVKGMEWLGAPKAGLLDTSNPEALDWMWQFYSSRTREGVDGWWLDLGEPERHDDDSQHVGGSVNQVHNEFADLWTARVYRGLRTEFADVRPFLMPRAGTAGMQRYGAMPWTGDIRRSYAGLQAQVPALINAGMSGIGYIGSDVSGFATDGVGTVPHLYLRWIQQAVFSPMMRTHSTLLPEPYQPCYSDVLPQVRRYINLRYSYLPYTYTLAYENAVTGAPLARTLCYHDTQDGVPSPAGCLDQYLWGRNIMVAPVMTEGAVARSITFPQGRWVDLNNTAVRYEGGTTVSYAAPLDVLPHFGRVGSFVAQFAQTEYDHTGNIDRDKLTVTYLADLDSNEEASGLVFEDNHVSPTSIEDGKMLLTRFIGKETESGHGIWIRYDGAFDDMPDKYTYNFVVPGYGAAVSRVLCNGADVTYLQVDGQLSFMVEAVPSGETKIEIYDSSAGIAPVDADTCGMTYDAATCAVLCRVSKPTAVSVHSVSGALAGRWMVTDRERIELRGLSAGAYVVSMPGARPVKAVVR